MFQATPILQTNYDDHWQWRDHKVILDSMAAYKEYLMKDWESHAGARACMCMEHRDVECFLLG